MADVPYILPLRAVTTANGTATLPFTSPRNESYRFSEVRISSTGAFQINSLRTSTGLQYTNASPQVPIESTLFQQLGSPNIGITTLPLAIEVGGGETMNIDIQDTSAAPNTVRVYLVGVRTLG